MKVKDAKIHSLYADIPDSLHPSFKHNYCPLAHIIFQPADGRRLSGMHD